MPRRLPPLSCLFPVLDLVLSVGDHLGRRCLVGSAHPGCPLDSVPVRGLSFVLDWLGGPAGPPPFGRLVHSTGRIQPHPGQYVGLCPKVLGFRAHLRVPRYHMKAGYANGLSDVYP